MATTVHGVSAAAVGFRAESLAGGLWYLSAFALHVCNCEALSHPSLGGPKNKSKFSVRATSFTGNP